MELYLQFGHAMMEHCRTLLTAWGGGTVVLSPRDLKHNQLLKMGKDIAAIPGGECLLDPQFYLPRADHEKLTSHAYWPTDYQTGMFWHGAPLTRLIGELRQLNSEIGCSRFLLPGLLAAHVDDDWLAVQRAIVSEGQGSGFSGEVVATIALSADAVRDADQVATLIESAEAWGAVSYYVVCEHPNGDYLTSDPNWLANVLDLAAGLRLMGARVILGYCSHQMLIAGAAKVAAIASGTWMNVRSFPQDKFKAAFDDDIKRKSVWYYCPQALSEYKIPFLDIAQRLGVLSLMAPPPLADGGYTAALFSGTQPSAVEFGEQAAFRHYLHALKCQVAALPQGSFDEAVEAHQSLLVSAETLLERLHGANIRGQLRDFADIVDVNRAALGLFAALRGPVMRREWSRL